MKFILAIFISLLSSSLFAFIEWEKIRNPIYQHEGWSVKDATMIYHKPTGHFHLFFSAFFKSNGRIRSHVASVKTKDFVTFSEPLFVWSGEEIGYKGFAAPEIIELNGQYILTYNSWGDKFMKPNKLFYAVSTDLENWDRHRPLALNVTRNKRAIDVALAYENGKYIINWKEGRIFQKSRISVADSLDGPWKTIGRPIKTWMENGQLLKIDGEWNMVMTGEGHLPYISKLEKQPVTDRDWLNWGPIRKLDVPLEGFNTHDLSNAGHLRDWREFDGHFYLLYAGTTESDSYLGRGDNRLGLARSKDGIHWEVPGK